MAEHETEHMQTGKETNPEEILMEESPHDVDQDSLSTHSTYTGHALLKEAMLDAVSESDAHFKHQQRGEPDLTTDEKKNIAAAVLDKNPAIFLERFGKYLTEEHLSYFSMYSGDYAVDFYMKEIRKQLDVKKSKVKVRNRRYVAMKQLAEKGDYFSEEEMKSRDPLLYDQLIGQFLSEEEILAQTDKCEASLANILMNHIQVQKNNELFQMQKEVEKRQLEAMDDVEEDQTKKDIDPVDVDEEDDESELESEDEENAKWLPSNEDKLQMREDFIRTMEHRFLNGEDPDFNYDEVDGNEKYDSLDIRNQDEEEKYFDEEDPASIHSQTSDR